MPNIALEKTSISSIAHQLEKMQSESENAKNKIQSALTGLDFEVASKRSIEARLNNVKVNMMRQEEKSGQYKEAFVSATNSIVEKDSKYGKGAIRIVDIIKRLVPVKMTFGTWQMLNKITKFGALSSLFLGSTGVSSVSYLDRIKENVKNAFNSVKTGVQDLYGNAVKATKDCISWVKEKYNEKGVFYTTVQYGKAAVKIIGGISAIAVSVGAIAGSAGAASPLAFASIAYGVNDVISGVKDVVDIHADVEAGGAGDIEENNLLKDGSKFIIGGAGGAVGELFGNAELGEEIGERIGAVAYDAGHVVTTIYNISTGWDQIKQATDFNLRGMANEFDDAIKGSWDLVSKVEFNNISDVVKVNLTSPFSSNIVELGDGLRYQLTLLGKELPNTVNAFKNLSLVNNFVSNVVGNPIKIIESVFKNDVLKPGGLAGHIIDGVEAFVN